MDGKFKVLYRDPGRFQISSVKYVRKASRCMCSLVHLCMRAFDQVSSIVGVQLDVTPCQLTGVRNMIAL